MFQAMRGNRAPLPRGEPRLQQPSQHLRRVKLQLIGTVGAEDRLLGHCHYDNITDGSQLDVDGACLPWLGDLIRKTPHWVQVPCLGCLDGHRGTVAGALRTTSGATRLPSLEAPMF